MRIPEAPLFLDPIYLGAADPTIIWNQVEKEWWIVYTQRPSSLPGPGTTSIHGSALGVASSPDGHDWLYSGTLEGLEFEPGRNTFWAPEILFEQGQYHMYVSYVRGMPVNWNRPRWILHYTSDDLWHWTYQSRLEFGPGNDKIIDACVARCPDGWYRLWYKNEEDHGHTHVAQSQDLHHWEWKGPVITLLSHEGPNAFQWKGAWWMLTDAWRGQAVFRSEDTLSWTYTGMILDDEGTRPMDNTIGHHAKVLVVREEAYVFYFTHPNRQDPDPVKRKMTALQVARLSCDGQRITCDRNTPFDFSLPTGEELGHFS